MTGISRSTSRLRCAIYTRKSTEEGLEQEFNSLHAQREACEAYIRSQRSEGWQVSPDQYDDGGYSGGTMDRPALTRLIQDIEQGHIEVIIVYKVDRLSRSLADFVRLIELFDQHDVSFVSVTQQFNTSSSMGRLTLNVLLSFAQFEREVTGERIRDKIAASKRKGMWMGGVAPLGYDAKDKALVINPEEADTVRHIYARYLALGCVRRLKAELDAKGYVSKIRHTGGRNSGGKPFSRGALYTVLKNPVYVGQIAHRGKRHAGRHEAIVELALWEQVQDKLARNRKRKALRTAAKDPGLLAGLLYDSQGHAMSPTHTRKGSRRYRYYVSQAILQYRESQAGEVTRLPAEAIETIVTGRLLDLLRKPVVLFDQIIQHSLTATQQQAVILRTRTLANDWSDWPPSNQIACLKRLIRAIHIHRDYIEIIFSRAGLTATLMEAQGNTDTTANSENDAYRLSVPVRLKRCGLETRLVLDNGGPPPAHHRSIRAIQDTLAKALAWNEALMHGKVDSVNTLAKREGVDQRHIARQLKLGWLAPDIIESITRGDIPSTVSLTRLKKGFPLEWEEQRKVLGFTA